MLRSDSIAAPRTPLQLGDVDNINDIDYGRNIYDIDIYNNIYNDNKSATGCFV